MTIEENLIAIRELVSQSERNFGRPPGSVQLLAASKGQSVEKITAALHAGQYMFGENYLQEALRKIAALDNTGIEWHFIGPVQSNKTRKIAEHFSWVHSIDSLKIAKRLSAQRPSYLPPLNICIEVNVSEQASKSGVLLEDAIPLAKHCLTLPSLKLRGLMAIPAPKNSFEADRAEFHKLFAVFQRLCELGIPLDTLSMGMSTDFEAAIAEGSTMIRIGTAIFGKREKR